MNLKQKIIFLFIIYSFLPIKAKEVFQKIKNGNILTKLELETRNWQSNNLINLDLSLTDKLMLKNNYKYGLEKNFVTKKEQKTQELNIDSLYQLNQKTEINSSFSNKKNKSTYETITNNINNIIKISLLDNLITNIATSVGDSKYSYEFIDLDRNGIADYKDNKGIDFANAIDLQYKFKENTKVETKYNFNQNEHKYIIEKTKNKFENSHNFNTYFEHNLPKINVKFNTIQNLKYNRYERGVDISGQETYKNENDKKEIILNFKNINYSAIECKKTFGKNSQKFELVQDRCYDYIDDDFSLNINTNYKWLNLNLEYLYEEDGEIYPIRLQNTTRKEWQDKTDIIYNFISLTSNFSFLSPTFLKINFGENLFLTFKTHVGIKGFLHQYDEEKKNGDDRELISKEILSSITWNNIKDTINISLSNSIYHKNYFYKKYTKDNNQHYTLSLNSSLTHSLISNFFLDLNSNLEKNTFDYIFEKKYLKENQGKNSEVTAYNLGLGILYKFLDKEIKISYNKNENFNNYLYNYKTSQNREKIVHSIGTDFKISKEQKIIFIPCKSINLSYKFNYFIDYGYFKFIDYNWKKLSTDFYHSIIFFTNMNIVKNLLLEIGVNTTFASKDRIKNFADVMFSMNYYFAKNEKEEEKI